jgi:hypothetical protein
MNEDALSNEKPLEVASGGKGAGIRIIAPNARAFPHMLFSWRSRSWSSSVK